jgi:hypothetical protein
MFYQYTSEARKAQYLTYCEIGLKNTQAAEKAGIKQNTGYNIWASTGQLEIDYLEKDLQLPTIEKLVAVKPKAGRPKVLSKLDCIAIFVIVWFLALGNQVWYLLVQY